MSLSIITSFKNLMAAAEEEENKIIELGNQLDAERALLEEQLTKLQNKAQELMARKLRLKENVNKLTEQVNSIDNLIKLQEDNSSSEIGYFIAEDGYCYVDTFDRQWLEDHVDNQSGPLYCSNCEAFGTINQDGRLIFLGYCLNCSDYLYNNGRGCGFEGFETANDRDRIEKDTPEHLKKYRELLLSYIDKRMNDLETLAQFPSIEQLPPPPPPSQSEDALPSVSHSGGDCDGCCDESYDDVESNGQDDESTDDYAILCDCCHPEKQLQQKQLQ